MPRRRRGPAPDPFADYPPEDRKQAAIMKRRRAYLVTNRHMLHEAAVLVDSGFRHGWFRTRDLAHLAREVAEWADAQGVDLTSDQDRYWRVREAIQALRPELREPLPWQKGGSLTQPQAAPLTRPARPPSLPGPRAL